MIFKSQQMELQALIQGCIDGEARCQQELYTSYSARCYAICRRYTNTDADAEDALVEGFMHVYQQIAQYKGHGAFEGWLFRIFMREAAHTNTRSQRRRQLHRQYSDMQPPAMPVNPAAESIDLQILLQTTLRNLSPRENAIFNMVAIDGLSLREAAEVLQTNEGAAKSLYHRTRQKLKKLIE